MVSRKQAGFSLVELMVVVAIIGVLAAVAIPSLNGYMAKAKQSEAKTNLSAYYMAQKAFFAEFNTYDSRFGPIGFAVEGRNLYAINTLAAGNFVATPATFQNTNNANYGAAGVNGAANVAGVRGSATFTGNPGGVAGGFCSIAGSNCTVASPALVAGVAPTVPATAGGVNSAVVFSVFASGQIKSSPATQVHDRWVIDHTKTLANQQVGY